MAKFPLNPKIERIEADLADFAKIGGHPSGGVTRLAFSEEEEEALSLLRKKAEEIGMTVSRDSFGNLFADLSGQDDLPKVWCGSHLDSVPNGGRFDGTLGVVAALEIARSLKELNQPLTHGYRLVCFVAEEAARFGRAMLGSSALVGKLPKSEIESCFDQGGVSIAEAVRQVGRESGCLQGGLANSEDILAFFELHIEQGRVLERLGCPIGIADRIANSTRAWVTVVGRADHSGTTPMGDRLDALLGASQAIQIVSHGPAKFGGPESVATVGAIQLDPNVLSVIPGVVRLGVDVRDIDLDRKERVASGIFNEIEQDLASQGFKVSVEVIKSGEPVALSSELKRGLVEKCQQLDLSFHEMHSGAGHDAMNLALFGVPSSLVFVPSRDGVSHSPDEYTASSEALPAIKLVGEVIADMVGL